MNKARSLTGHRIGEWHHKSNQSDDKVRHARELREQGKTYKQIGSIVGVHWRTVCDWCNYVTRYDA